MYSLYIFHQASRYENVEDGAQWRKQQLSRDLDNQIAEKMRLDEDRKQREYEEDAIIEANIERQRIQMADEYEQEQAAKRFKEEQVCQHFSLMQLFCTHGCKVTNYLTYFVFMIAFDEARKTSEPFGINGKRKDATEIS